MSEVCPLYSGKMRVGDLPELCHMYCEKLWGEAITLNNTMGEYNAYQPALVWDECDHVDTEIGFSRESLQAIDMSALRLYMVVDECIGCGEDLGEQTYRFNCPQNNPEM